MIRHGHESGIARDESQQAYKLKRPLGSEVELQTSRGLFCHICGCWLINPVSLCLPVLILVQ